VAAASRTSGTTPKLLKATYLADSEGLLRETRATGLFYFPAPIFWLIVFGILDYWALANRYNLPLPASLSSAWKSFPTIGGYAPSSYLVTLFAIITLLLLIWLLVRYLRWISTIYAVTTHRVIIQRGIVSRDFEEIPIPQVRGVDVHQSVGQRMLGYGTVLVSSEGTARVGNEAWKGIPRPFEFQRLIEGANQTITGNVGRTSGGRT
jgi:membrane protein YdbS with pleckstrin-like domain